MNVETDIQPTSIKLTTGERVLSYRLRRKAKARLLSDFLAGLTSG